MVSERVTDGVRIAELLASEVDGRSDGALDRLAVVDAREDVVGTPHGAFAYGVELDGERFADVHVHDDRVRVELRTGLDAGAAAADDAGLRVRTKAVQPPRALVFVESGAAVKRAVDALLAAVAATDESG